MIGTWTASLAWQMSTYSSNKNHFLAVRTTAISGGEKVSGDLGYRDTRWSGLPIRSRVLWTYVNKVRMGFARAGKPTGNAQFESFIVLIPFVAVPCVSIYCTVPQREKSLRLGTHRPLRAPPQPLAQGTTRLTCIETAGQERNCDKLS